MSTSAPQTRPMYETRGLRVVVVDLMEFEKLEGCVTCLSVRIRRWGSGTNYALALKAGLGGGQPLGADDGV